MTDLLGKAADVVRSAEQSLRELLQLGASQGEYDRVAVLARWAEQLSRITANGADRAEGKAVHVDSTFRPTRSPALRRRSRPKSQVRAKYPVFKRSGENLVKVAWSRAARSEYVHQAPRMVLSQLLTRMQDAAASDELIAIDRLLPLAAADGAEIPVYQVYVCLAWLRAIGVVKQHGRRGYSMLPKDDMEPLVEKAWAGLTIHRP